MYYQWSSLAIFSNVFHCLNNLTSLQISQVLFLTRLQQNCNYKADQPSQSKKSRITQQLHIEQFLERKHRIKRSGYDSIRNLGYICTSSKERHIMLNANIMYYQWRRQEIFSTAFRFLNNWQLLQNSQVLFLNRLSRKRETKNSTTKLINHIRQL